MEVVISDGEVGFTHATLWLWRHYWSWARFGSLETQPRLKRLWLKDKTIALIAHDRTLRGEE